MPPQGVMTCKQAIYSPGLKPIKGHEFRPGTQTRSRDKLLSLSLGITKTLPLGPLLVIQPATEPFLQILPRDTQGRLRSKKPLSIATPCESIGDFITSRWVDNIRMDLQEVDCGYVDWIGLAQDRDRWRMLVSAVMNLRVPEKCGEFLD